MILLNPYTHDTRVEKEAATLTDAGYHVTVVAEAAPGLPQQETVDGVDVRRVERPRGVAVLRYWAFRRALLRELITTRPQVIHAHDTETLQLAAQAADRLGVPFIYDAHDLWLGRQRRNRSAAYWALYRLGYWLIERIYLPRAAAHITVSQPIARHLEKAYGLPEVAVVSNFPEVSSPVEVRDLRTLPGATGIPPDAPIVLYIGHVMSGRGVEQLIRAMADVPAAHLVLLGGADQAARVDLRAKEAGVSERVHALDRVPAEEIQAYAASASIGVSPILDTCLNYRYSLPNKLFQYMAAGLPVVASDFEQVRAAVSETGSGVTVNTADPAAIAAAILGLLADPVAMAESGRCARRAVETRFNWREAGKVLLAAYQRVRPATSA